MQGTPRCATHQDADAEASCTRCGDFVCRLCTPLEPVALCTRCVVRATVDWEERGELGLLRAFWTTFRVSMRAPVRLGLRLGGAGHAVHALQYAALCSVCGLLPLSLLVAVPLLGWADALRLGLRSTGLLGTAVSLVPFALVVSTLVPLALALLAYWVWLCAFLCGVRVRHDVMLRGAAYGASLLAVPVLGPMLLPLVLGYSGAVQYGALCAHSNRKSALIVLGVATLSLAAFATWAALWLR